MRVNTMGFDDVPDLVLRPGMHRAPVIDVSLYLRAIAVVGAMRLKLLVVCSREAFLRPLTSDHQRLPVEEHFLVVEVPIEGIYLPTRGAPSRLQRG